MSTADRVTSKAGHLGRQAHRSDWVDRAARVGLLTYGVMHLLVGWLALQLAFGNRESSASSQGAVRELAQQPFGGVLVFAVGIGMFLLVVWQGVEAVLGHRDEDGMKKVWKRMASAGKAIVYAAIGVSALKTAIGSGSSSSEKETNTWTSRLMDLPGGQVLVAIVGVVILCIGGFLVVRAWTDKIADELSAEGRSGDTGTAYLWVGKIGYTAKGVAFGIVAVLFLYAALTHDPDKSGGLDQALTELLDKPLGPLLLGVVAVGIGCYGLFCFARARHLSR